MNSDLEDMLREGMERFTADLRAPAGLIRHAAQRRRRRLALRSVTGAATALTAGAVALVAVILPGAPAAPATGIDATAYVVQHVSSALTAAEPGDIAQIAVTRSVTTGGKTVTTTAQEWSYGDQWRSVTNSSAGQPLYDEGYSAAGVYTLVSYLTRTWARERGIGHPTAPAAIGLLLLRPGIKAWLPGLFRLRPAHPNGAVLVPRLCLPVVSASPLLFQPGLPALGFSAGLQAAAGFSAPSLPAARALRNAIACGILADAGRQSVGGIETIKLKSRPNSPISETIWVTPHNYLPVRVVITSSASSDGTPVVRQTADIAWLQPTAQNLAKLSVPIPAGYRRVSLIKVLLGIAKRTGPRLAGNLPLRLLYGKPW